MAITWNDILARIDRFTKKDVYIFLSLGLGVFLLACEINDVIHIGYTERTWETTATFTMALLLLHTIAFYSGILGYIYTSQANVAKVGKNKMVILALVAIVGNILAFILRIALEVACINFREEYYRLASESGK